ncbi:hypothetical protein IRB23SM22_02930 [Alkalibacterium sp. s-m-22]
MEINNLIEAKTRQELRQWLENNAKTAGFFWGIVSMKDHEGVIQYLDAVEEAIILAGLIVQKRKLLIIS